MSHEAVEIDEEVAAGDGSHASVGFYSFVAVILCLITALEVAVLYPPLSYMPDGMRVVILIFLSVVKFASVVAFFMHLYYDHPITTALFLTGLILASGTMVALLQVMPQAEHPLKPDLKKESHEASMAPLQVQERLSQWSQFSAQG